MMVGGFLWGPPTPIALYLTSSPPPGSRRRGVLGWRFTGRLGRDRCDPCARSPVCAALMWSSWGSALGGGVVVGRLSEGGVRGGGPRLVRLRGLVRRVA